MYMTTDYEIVPVVREVSVLLRLDTFQGMSDEEIQSLIDYYCERATEAEAFRLKSAAIAADSAYHKEQLDAITEQASSMVQSVLKSSIPWVRVSSEGTVISNV